jgi:hypothetical protein
MIDCNITPGDNSHLLRTTVDSADWIDRYVSSNLHPTLLTFTESTPFSVSTMCSQFLQLPPV